MKAVVVRMFKTLGFLASGPGNYRRETGQSLWIWLVMALLNGAVQVLFRRNLVPGEFATLNTALGAIALAVVPVLALRQALATFRGREIGPARGEILEEGRLPLVQNFTLGWTFFCALFFLPFLGFLHLPRFFIGLLALPNVFALLGASVCAALYEQRGRLRVWAFLVCLAGVVRLLTAWIFARAEPWAEAGLVAGLGAGFILITPILRQTRINFRWGKMSAVLEDREFMAYLGATLSVTLGIFLFTNGDRLVAQGCFGRSIDNNLGFVRWSLFDGYQTAGLLGRALLWGTQPLLAVLLVRRLGRDRTAREIFGFLWLYLGALFAGGFILYLLAQPLARLFGGADPGTTAYFIPGFAMAMMPLGLLQGIGMFMLASRRYPECWTLGGSGLAYTLFLALEGKPQLMLTCMFGGGGVALLIMIFLAVVRWGRTQP